MPGEPREIRIKRPASQIHCSRCLSFIPRRRVWRKQAFTDLGHTRWNGNTCCRMDQMAWALLPEVGDFHLGADALVCPVERVECSKLSRSGRRLGPRKRLGRFLARVFRLALGSTIRRASLFSTLT